MQWLRRAHGLNYLSRDVHFTAEDLIPTQPLKLFMLLISGCQNIILDPYFEMCCQNVFEYFAERVESYDQLTNYLEKLGYFSNPPKKSCNNFFWGAQDLIWVQLILIMQKITKKSLLGHFLGYPPKMHYSALQCSAMDWSASAWIIHSRWVKYDP